MLLVKMTPEELMKLYPHLDHMMAETILKSYENGTLAQYLEEWEDVEPKPATIEVVKGAVQVEQT